MARQLQAKQILILGNSNLRRNLAHAGRLYSQLSKVGLSRNLKEFREAANMIDPDHYKIVIFAMTINIVIAAGKTALDYDYASPPLMTAWSLLYVKLGMFLSSKDL